MVAEDPVLFILVNEEIDVLGDWKRFMSAPLASDEKEVLGGGIGRL